jgi:ferritin-like metal-binding protein YciE
MKIENLETLLREEMRDLYDAEKQLVKALPKMAKASSSPKLRDAFNEHLKVTKGQVTRIEQALTSMGGKAQSRPCAAMKGMIQEGTEMMRAGLPPELMDVALIANAQKVEHYEISGYGTCREIAGKLLLQEVADLLEETESEEKEADQKLTAITRSVLADVEMNEDTEDEEEETATSRKPARTTTAKKSSAGRAR